MTRLCAISVDLDEIHHYHDIHGLSARDSRGANERNHGTSGQDLDGTSAHDPGGRSAHDSDDRRARAQANESGHGRDGHGRDELAPSRLVYERALDRFTEWSCAESLPLTFFVVGADARRPENAVRLRTLAQAGHELGNHSLDHRYDLTRLEQDELRYQVEEGARCIKAAAGTFPRGFRAPGYTVSDHLFEVLSELQVEYDSSVFPCPTYWGAKALVLGQMRVRRKLSRSILDTPRVLIAPRRPYRVGRPYWRRGSGILELPIQVTRGLRLPFIGTALGLAGPATARVLTQGVLGEPLVNLELHGIDLLDRHDGLEHLMKHQSDLRVSKERKLEALGAVVSTLRRAGYTFVRLDEAAARFSGSCMS